MEQWPTPKGPETFTEVLQQIRQSSHRKIILNPEIQAGLNDADYRNLADAIRHNHGLVELDMDGESMTDKQKLYLEEALIGGDQKTLVSFGGAINGNIAQQLTLNFFEGTQHIGEMVKRLKDTTREEQLKRTPTWNPQVWLAIAERFAVLEDAYEQNQFPTLSEEVLQAFQSLIESMPRLDANAPLTLESLNEKEANGLSPADNPLTWQHFHETIAAQNANGFRLQTNDLLEEGQPNDLFKQIIQAGKAPALFTENNWAGANKHEFHAVLRALPPRIRAALPNLHSLTTAVDRQSGFAARS